MGLRIAVIGGGSTYTPELVDGIATREARLPVDELVLLDVDPERLGVVAGLARRMLARRGWPGRLIETTDRDAALEGADFVLVQLRVGGQAARLRDETIPLRHGLVGQETTGAGGFGKALRTVPVVLEIAEAVDRRSAPGSWLIDFTNPVGIVTQALLDDGHRAIGLCNVAIGFQRDFAERFGVTPEQVELEHVGLNHLSWERAIRVQGVDRLADVLDEGAEMVGLDPAFVHALGALPSYYLRYYYETARVVDEQRSHPSRASEVIDIERSLLELYRDPTLDTKPELLERRGGAYYSEAAAALMASLTDGAGDVQVADIRNGDSVPGLPPDAVVEGSARIDRDGAHPLPQRPLEPAMLDLVLAVKHYEMLTIEAARTGDRAIARAALVANPLVDPTSVDVLLDEILVGSRTELPRFFPDG